jgi:hypothetical protein
MLATSAIAGVKQPARKDAFHGTVASATGRFAGKHGHARIGFFPGSGTGSTRSLVITLTPRACREAKGCVRLHGTLHGSITRVPTIPDIGAQFKVTAHGTVRPLGRVTASGTAHGVGNALAGRETTQLTLTSGGGGGTVTVDGMSAQVPTFSSP